MSFFTHLSAKLILCFRYTWADLLKKPQSWIFKISIITFTIVTTFIMFFFYYIVGYIFLNFSEMQAGSADMIIRGLDVPLPLHSPQLDYGSLKSTLSQNPLLEGVVGRWKYSEAVYDEARTKTGTGAFILIDWEEEVKQGFQGKWTNIPPGANRIDVSISLLRLLYDDVTKNNDENGKNKPVIIEPSQLFISKLVDTDALLQVPTTPRAVFELIPKKIPFSSSFPLLMDKENLFSSFDSETKNSLSDVYKSMPSRVTEILLRFKGRYNDYTGLITDKRSEILASGAKVLSSLRGKGEFSVSYPILQQLELNGELESITSSVFPIAMTLLISLTALLLYSMLYNEMQKRYYEFAIMRTQGMSKSLANQVILTQAFCIILLSIITGTIGVVIFQEIIFAICRSLFSLDTPPIHFYPFGYGISVALGVFLTLVGYAQILHANSNSTVREALAMATQKVTTARVKTQRLVIQKFSLTPILIGFYLIGFGYIICVLFPSLFFQGKIYEQYRYSSLLVLAYLFGGGLIATFFMPILCWGMMWLILWGSEKRFFRIIQTNRRKHDVTNMMLFLVYVVGFSCLILCRISITIGYDVLLLKTKYGVGADISYRADDSFYTIDPAKLEPFLQKEKQAGRIESWSFAASTETQMSNEAYNGFVGPVGQSMSANIIGVNKTFQETVFPELVAFHAVKSEYKYEHNTGISSIPNVVKSISTDPPLNKICRDSELTFAGGAEFLFCRATSGIFSGIFQTHVYLTTEGTILIKQSTYGQKAYDSTFYIEPRAIAKRFSGIEYMLSQWKFDTLSFIIPIDDFSYLVNPGKFMNPDNSYSIHFFGLFVRMSPKTVLADHLYVGHQLHKLSDQLGELSVVLSLVEEINEMTQFIGLLFIFIALIDGIITVLLLFILLTILIKGDYSDIAVLRSMGISNFEMIRIYAYETLITFIPGILIGLGIGVSGGALITSIVESVMNISTGLSFPWKPILIYVLICFIGLAIIHVNAYFKFKGMKLAEVIKAT